MYWHKFNKEIQLFKDILQRQLEIYFTACVILFEKRNNLHVLNPYYHWSLGKDVSENNHVGKSAA